ncbi:MAG TPA: cytidine deaminase [Gemmatimonadota bacterium]|nr:cytidine deaminase [Gemmatimonadota bacterium]
MTTDLEARARDARDRAYAPYSGYRVGAALEAADGRVFDGCNVENAAYSVTCCAERVALHSAVAAGAREFRRLVVAASGRMPFPCGSCRQALSEFVDDLPIVVLGDGSQRHELSLAELLPRPFRFEEGRPA